MLFARIAPVKLCGFNAVDRHRISDYPQLGVTEVAHVERPMLSPSVSSGSTSQCQRVVAEPTRPPLPVLPAEPRHLQKFQVLGVELKCAGEVKAFFVTPLDEMQALGLSFVSPVVAVLDLSMLTGGMMGTRSPSHTCAQSCAVAKECTPPPWSSGVACRWTLSV